MGRRDESLDREAFAYRVRSALGAASIVSERDIAYDSAAFALQLAATILAQQRDPAGSRLGPTLSLENLYADYLHAAPENRDRVIQVAVATVAEMLEEALTPEQARASLRVQLRQRAWAERYAPIRRVFAERLALCLCLDRPNSIRYVKEDDLLSWDLEEETAFTLGLAGLERATGTEGGLEPGVDGVFRSVWRDTYDAARAVLPWLLCKVPASGNRALAIPNRDTLLVADHADPAALAALAAQTRVEYDHPRAVSPCLLEQDSERVLPLKLPEDHPVHAAARELEVVDTIQQADVQQEALEADLAARGEDVFVARLSAFEHRAGRVLTYAVWTEDVEPLLPEADLVVLVSGGEGGQVRGVYPFSDLQTNLGHLLLPAPDLGYPPRFRVQGYPTPEQFAQLGEPLAL